MLCGATLQGAKNYIAELQRKAGMGMEQMQAKVKSDREVAHAKQMQQHQAQIRAAHWCSAKLSEAGLASALLLELAAQMVAHRCFIRQMDAHRCSVRQMELVGHAGAVNHDGVAVHPSAVWSKPASSG